MFGDSLLGFTGQGVPPAPLHNYRFMQHVAPPVYQKSGIPLQYNEHRQEYQNSGYPFSQLHLPTFTLPELPSPGSKDEDKSIKVTLENKELWKSFDRIGTEMIVTKPGRRMFPTLKLQCEELNPIAKYVILVDVIPVDNCRYKYNNSEWSATGKAEPHIPNRLYIHPDSPAPGSHWMKKTISFNKMKLTNNKMDKHGHIILHTMQKYKTRVHIIRANDVSSMNWGQSNTTVLDDTTFIPVTAYQSEQITKLKVDNNPFAKGFRDNKRTCFGGKRYREEDIGCALIEDDCPSSKRQRIHQEFGAENISDLDILYKEFVLQPNTSGFTTESRPYEQQSPVLGNGNIPEHDQRDSSPFGNTAVTTKASPVMNNSYLKTDDFGGFVDKHINQYGKASLSDASKVVETTKEYTNSIKVSPSSEERCPWNWQPTPVVSDGANLPINNTASQPSSSPDSGLSLSASFDNSCLSKQSLFCPQTSSPSGSELSPSSLTGTAPSSPVNRTTPTSIYDASESTKYVDSGNISHSYLPVPVLPNYGGYMGGGFPSSADVKPNDMIFPQFVQNSVPQPPRKFVPCGLPSGSLLSDTGHPQSSHSNFYRYTSETNQQTAPLSNTYERNFYEHPIFSLRHNLPC